MPTTDEALAGSIARRAVSGVLLFDKPTGITSNAALQKVRRLFDRAKAGHTGTLDPLASGLLPICIGEATKFSHPILNSPKSYQATMQLGWRSSTGDAEGDLTELGEPDFDSEKLATAIQELTGEIEQKPPMYSAVKVDGERLYKLARKGISVERKSRQIHVHTLDVLSYEGQQLSISVTCSKGTYIRTLAEDLGEKLGCGAYLTALRRVAIGDLSVAEAIELGTLEDLSVTDRIGLLKPIDLLLTDLPKLTLNEANAKRLSHGITVDGPADTPVCEIRVYTEQGDFLGLGEVLEDRTLKPKRLLSQTS